MNWPPEVVGPAQFVMLSGCCPHCVKALREEDTTAEPGRLDRHACGIYLPEDWRERLRLFASVPAAMRVTI